MSDFSQQFPVVFGALNEGFLQTLKLFAITLFGALPLGFLIYFGEVSAWAPFAALGRRLYAAQRCAAIAKFFEDFCPIAAVVRFIIWVVRGTPLMLQLLVIYYFPGLSGTDRFGAAAWMGVFGLPRRRLFLITPVILRRFTAAESKAYRRASRRQGRCLA